MSSGLKASTESVNSTAAFQEDVEEWRRVVAKYMDDGKGGGVLYYNGIRAIVTPLLFASAALMMILIVTSTVVKVPFLVHIALPNITILTFLMLLIGAGFFAVAVVLGDGCHLVVQERGAVLSNMYNTKTVENFFAARDQCLSDPSRSLVQFASQIGVNMEAINLTVAAAPTIDELDLSKFPRLNLTDIIPGTVTAFREQSITELFTSINETLGLNFFAPLRTFNFTTTQRSLATLKASLAPFIGSPSDYASTQISTVPNSTTVLRDFDLDEFDVIVRNIIALQSGLERNVNAIVEAIEKTIDAVNGMSIGIERGQSAGGGVPVYLNATLALLNQFSDEVNRNIPRFTPVAKSMLYEIVNANYERALAKLPCENLASETLVLQQSVCVGISESFDIMWFAFMACGVSLLICLSCLGCITNRLVTGIPPWSQTIKRDASMSTISTSSGTLFNDGRRRKFGKAEYTLKPVKNADDLLPEDVYSPEWATTHQPFGSGDTFSDQPPIAPVAEFNERMPPSPVLSSASAARGRQILVAPLPGEIRGRSSRRTSDVPKGVNSSMANYFKE
ncbi:hypothetical protein BC829DRAFT_116046 [Chytridium lagenaria]|nr:hypothetical protein BC829DRAFT_116046 [Chytridium lagenaria]